MFGGGVPTSPTNFNKYLSGVALGIYNPDGLTVLSQTYTGAQGSINQSITRNPDLTGDFV